MVDTIEKLNLNRLNKSNWKTYRFDQIAKSISERVDPTNTFLDIYVGLEHIDSESIHITRFGKRENVTGTKLRCYPGDVIFGRRRAYQRKAAIVEFDGFCSAHSLVLRANPKVIDPKLFPFFLHSDSFMNRAIDISVGSLSPTINWGTLKTQEFYLPPIEQQAELAELLWTGDEMIETLEALHKAAIEYRSVRAAFLLGLDGNGANRPSWVSKKLHETAPLQRGFDLPNSKFDEGEYPVCYSNGIGKYHKEFKVKGPGVCTGRSGTIGNVFYIESNYWPHNTSLWVTDFKGNHPKFIYHLYSRLRFEKKMAGSGVPTLNRNDLHKMEVKIPEYKEQIQISDSIDELETSCKKVKETLLATRQLQKNLINKIF